MDIFYNDPPEILIQCNDEPLIVKRCGYFDHAKYQLLLKKLQETDDPDIKINALDHIMETLCGRELNDFSFEEFAIYFTQIMQLNEPLKIFEWQKPTPEIEGMPKKPEVRTTVDYDERFVMQLADLLAHEYGWTLKQIYDAQPEAVYGLMQECILRDRNDKEFMYSLSEVAYDKKGQYKQYPVPTWYSEIKGKTAEELTPVKIPASYLPGGVVIDHEKTYNENKQKENKHQNSKDA